MVLSLITLAHDILSLGDAKFDEMKDGEGKVSIENVSCCHNCITLSSHLILFSLKFLMLLLQLEDPYLKYGGSYGGDPKDSRDFKYVTFSELPKFSDAHRSAMAKYLTTEVKIMQFLYLQQ